MSETRKRLLLAASFFLPFFLLLALYALLGIAPFGEQTLLLADGKGQYLSFFALYQDIFAGRADPFYSFGKLLGGPVSGLYAYYLASPFNLLLLLFPKDQLALGVNWIILLKLSGCGLTMGVYLKHTRTLRPASLLFTTAYALCGYNTAYAWCVIWLDAVLLLPLVALGIERLWREGKPLLYILSLGLAIISCFYTGYMLCVFSVLYLSWRLICDTESLRRIPWRRLLQFALASLLAGGLSAWMLLPGFQALSGGVPVTPYESLARLTYPAATRILRWLPGGLGKESLVLPVLLLCGLLFAAAVGGLLLAFFRLRRRPALVTAAICLGFFVLWYALIDVPICREELLFSRRWILPKLLLGLVPYWEFYDGSPNLYAGSLALLLGLSFFLNRALSRRERAAGGVFLLVLLASACFYLPNLVWHGFEENSCFNYRWSFVFSFVLLLLAERSFAKREGLRPSALLIPGLAAGAVLVLAALRPLWFQESWMLLLAAAFLCAELGLLLRWRTGSPVARRLLCATGIAALCLSAGLSYADQAWHSTALSTQSASIESEQRRVDLARPGEGEFYRIRKTGALSNKNDPLLFDYAGLVHFSSAEKRSTILFLTRMGQHTYLKYWANGDEGESRAADALLGVARYLGPDAPAGYRALSEGVWENPDWLPLAYLADRGADRELPMDTEVCRNLNGVFRLLTGGEAEIFAPAEAEGLRLTVRREDPLYLQSWSPAITGCMVFSGGVPVAVFRDLYYPNALCLGSYPPGTELEIRLSGTVIPPPPEMVFFYEDGAELSRCVEELRRGDCETEILSASHLEIRTKAEEERLLVLTLPADEGWAVTLDGQRVEPETALEVLLALPIPAGEHSVSLRYTPPGLKAGLALSVLSLAATAAWALWRRRKGLPFRA